MKGWYLSPLPIAKLTSMTRALKDAIKSLFLDLILLISIPKHIPINVKEKADRLRAALRTTSTRGENCLLGFFSS